MVNALNYIVLSVSADNGSQIVFNETVPSSGFPIMLVSDTPFEIIQADSQVDANTLAVTRAQEGTTQQALTTSTTVICELTNNTLADVYDGILEAQKVMGNAYTTAERTAITPEIGDIALDTTEGVVYIGVSGAPNTWEVFNPDTHTDYADLLTSTAHTQYYTETRGDTWHGNLLKDHLNNLDHDHLDYPAANIRNLASQPADTFIGGIWLKNGASALYFYDGTGWRGYDTVPQYMMIFKDDGVCPDGWTEKTGWNNKYLKGASAGSYVGGSGGSLTHVHTLTDVPAHAHTVPSRNIAISTDGIHRHSVSGSKISGGSGAFRFSDHSQGVGTNVKGDHSHSITVPQQNTGSAGSTASTGLESSEPVHVELTLCEKN